MHIGSVGRNKRSLVPSSPEPDSLPPSFVAPDGSTKKLTFFNFLTLSLALLGVQFTWTVELGQGNPYLMNLGVDPAYSFAVWLLGPISGFITHPIVGGFSDRCTSRFGRRRPFIFGGVLICIACFFLLAYCRELGGSPDVGTATSASIAIAIFSFGALDFAVNAVQASARSLIMDIAPFSQQETANLWASSMIHIGNIVGYGTAFINLKALIGKEGDGAQFQILSEIAAAVLIITTSITCFLFKEKVFTPMSSPLGFLSFIFQPFVDVFRATLKLPISILFLCFIQFFCWVGWFPVLFYATTYISQVHTQRLLCRSGSLCDEATRIGQLGNLYNAVVAFAVCIALFIMQGTRFSVSLPRLWQLGSILFTILTWSTYFIYDTNAALAYNALLGICWAIGTWVPMAILGQILTKNEDEAPSTPPKKGKSLDPPTSSGPHLDTEQSACNASPAVPMSVGIVLGIHNVFIVLPQILSSFIGMGITELAPDDGAHVPGTNADPIGWTMRMGGISSFIAFFMIFWYIRILRRTRLC